MIPLQFFGNFQNFMAQFNQFKQQIQQEGVNPQQRVQELLQSGKMSQQQFEQCRQIANMFMNNMKP